MFLGSYGYHYYIVLNGQVITLIPNQKQISIVDSETKAAPKKGGFLKKVFNKMPVIPNDND